MDNIKGILILLVLAFGAASFIFFIEYRTADAQLQDASVLNDVTLQLLKAQGVSCSSTVQYSKTAACIVPLLQQKDFKEDAFGQPDPKKNATGYLVIKNINSATYKSERFTFLYNRQVAQQGCTVPGSIDKNVDCRFNFEKFCDKGSVLEVTYTTDDSKTTKVFTRNC